MVDKVEKAIDEYSTDLSLFASFEKAKCGRTYQVVSNESNQMIGGIGMMDDEGIGFSQQRTRVAQQTFGDANFHLDRYARLRGY